MVQGFGCRTVAGGGCVQEKDEDANTMATGKGKFIEKEKKMN